MNEDKIEISEKLLEEFRKFVQYTDVESLNRKVRVMLMKNVTESPIIDRTYHDKMVLNFGRLFILLDAVEKELEEME